MKWFQVSTEYFNSDSITTQLSIGSHAVINLELNTIKNQKSYKFFTDWFDNSFLKTADEYKQNVSCKYFDGRGCFIKTIDFNPNSKILKVSICCDYIQVSNISERRDDKIDDILKNK